DTQVAHIAQGDVPAYQFGDPAQHPKRDLRLVREVGRAAHRLRSRVGDGQHSLMRAPFSRDSWKIADRTDNRYAETVATLRAGVVVEHGHRDEPIPRVAQHLPYERRAGLPGAED